MAPTDSETTSSAVILSARIGRFDILETVDDGPAKHVQYTIHVKRDRYSFDIRKRFSEFADLHSEIVNSRVSDATLNLPPKTLFRCFDEEYLGQRMNALNVYLAEICRRPELHAVSAVLKFFEPQLQPEWGGSVEPQKPGLLGIIRDIAKGGRRSKDTFTTVLQMTTEHNTFKKDIAEMMERHASDDEIKSRSSAYLTNAAEKVRDMMLKNGGFQVKMGQAISAQKAMLPQEITQTLAACCDKANSLPLSAIKEQVTLSVGRPLEEVFSFISEEPLAAASIAQVHRATLRDSGEDVVVKVVHPGVADSMRADAAFMPFLIKLIERVEPHHGMHPLSVTMESMLKQELDMRREGQNRERLAAVVAHSARSERSEHADVAFPRVHWELCREGLMVQEFAKGAVALTTQAEVEGVGVPYRLAVSELAELFGETAFVHGYLHNDLHPGNVLVRPKLTSRPPRPATRRMAVTGLLSAMYLSAAILTVVLLRCLVLLIAPWQAWFCAACCSLAALAGSVAFGSTISDVSATEKLHAWLGSGLVLAASGLGLHLRLCGKVERLVSRAAGDRFELIIIDHGFHTYLPFDFRMTWCKVWAAVGLVDEPLLKEAAAELNLEGDEYRVLPLILCLLPYPVWLRHEFPSPADLMVMLKDEDFGLPRCAAMDKKMPHLWHLVMRVNGQVSALFQMLYGITPACRFEFMRFMTRSALMGRQFSQRPLGELPVPGCLWTADREFFERELPSVEERMQREFRWNQHFKGEKWEPNQNFLNNLKKAIASDRSDGKESEVPESAPAEAES